jgi:5-hydroxyisourate hydrolase
MRVAVGAVSVTLDAGGRAELLGTLEPGGYEILFHAGAYLGDGAFYDVIPVRFTVTDPAQHYHIPLILSPYGYSTYRGG